MSPSRPRTAFRGRLLCHDKSLSRRLGVIPMPSHPPFPPPPTALTLQPTAPEFDAKDGNLDGRPEMVVTTISDSVLKRKKSSHTLEKS